MLSYEKQGFNSILSKFIFSSSKFKISSHLLKLEPDKVFEKSNEKAVLLSKEEEVSFFLIYV